MSEFSAQNRKLIHTDIKGVNLHPDEKFIQLLTAMQNGSIQYGNKYFVINDSNFNEIKRVPFIKMREDGWWFYEDPRGLGVIISPLGEKSVLTFFDYSTKVDEFQIAFNMTD